MKIEEAPARHQFGQFAGFQLWLAGVDRDLLATCPLRDVHNVKTIAWLLMIVWFWQASLFCLVGHMMLAQPGEFRVAILVGGLVLASVVLLVDSYVIVRSSWHLQGIAELARGGLTMPGTLGAKVKNGAFVAVRLLLSVVLVQLMAIFLSLLLFAKDITTDLDQRYLTENRELLDRITGQTDGTITTLKAEHAEVRGRLVRLADEEAKLRQTVVDPLGESPEARLAIDRITKLTQSKAEAERELKDAQTFSANELGGVAGVKGNTGIPGRGPVRRAAEERVTNAEVKLKAIGQELAAADAKLAKLGETTSGASSQRRSAAEAKLVETSAAKKDRQDRLGLVEGELKRFTENREAIIRAAFEADPSYKRKEEGFLANWQGLRRLTADPYVLVVVALFDLALFGIELAAVLAKIATFVPATYATIIAHDDFRRAYKTAHELAREIEAIQQDRGRPEDDEGSGSAEPEPEPPKPTDPSDSGAALHNVFSGNGADDAPPDPQAEPVSVASAPDTAERRKRRGRPSGPRWKPHLKPGDGSDSDQSSKPAGDGDGRKDESNKGDREIE